MTDQTDHLPNDADEAPVRSDADLVLRTRSGDAGAYADLWRRHYASGIAVARSITSTFDADDLVQEAFARIYQAIQKGGGPTGSFRAYLFTSIRNTAAGWGRARHESPIDELDAVADPSSTEQAASEALDQSLSAQAFRSLPSRWQEVLWYTEIEQMKPAEVAPLLGMTAGATSQLAFRAREGLREAWIQTHLRTAEPGSVCEWTIERLGAYSRGNLGNRDRAKLEAHLGECARCLIVAAEAKEVSHRLALVLLPLVLGIGGSGAYLAMLQSGTPVVALAAMPSSVVQGAVLVGSGVVGASAVGSGAAGSGAAGSGGAASSGGIIAGFGALVGVGSAALVIAGAIVAAAVVPGLIAAPASTSAPSASDKSDSSIVAQVSPLVNPPAPQPPAPPAPSTPPAPRKETPKPPVAVTPVPSTPPQTDVPAGDSSAPVTPPVTPPDTSPPADPGAGADPGTDPGTGTGTDPGTGTGTDPGTGTGTDPGTGTGTDPGTGTGTDPGTGTGTPPPAPVLGTVTMDCGVSLSGRRVTLTVPVSGTPGATVLATIGTGSTPDATETLDASGNAVIVLHPLPSQVNHGTTVTFAYAPGDTPTGSTTLDLSTAGSAHWWECILGTIGSTGSSPATVPATTAPATAAAPAPAVPVAPAAAAAPAPVPVPVPAPAAAPAVPAPAPAVPAPAVPTPAVPAPAVPTVPAPASPAPAPAVPAPAVPAPAVPAPAAPLLVPAPAAAPTPGA
ncbi:sigma-70 family RNA polymerase sigma factor [Microbacterium panaciterrae]|uniref:RNA polymerase sigma factor, sigma-70 family n=1 Tax=Microbacterium panaciterrae TaxID=985759 RepID=A0ABP8P2F4_9MICO